MDGVTDVAYRIIQAKYGKPDVTFTEFIPVEGIVRLVPKLMRDFWYDEVERPVVAQIYGNEPDLFYTATQIVCELGFDGIDINMGCPARSVVHRGCGAALINTPQLAQDLVKATKQAVVDWVANGIDWDRWPVLTRDQAQTEFARFVANSQSKGFYKKYSASVAPRKQIPVSVKTRIGFSQPVVETWLTHLFDVEPAVLSLHGRTLKQMYTGLANWDEIGKAVALRDEYYKGRTEKPLLLGNGDVKTAADALEKVRQTNVDGVLIGRGTQGNPWVVPQAIAALRDGVPQEGEVSLEQKFAVMVEHAKLHEFYKEPSEFVQMRKNLAWYIGGIPGAARLRARLVMSKSSAEVAEVCKNYRDLLEF